MVVYIIRLVSSSWRSLALGLVGHTIPLMPPNARRRAGPNRCCLGRLTILYVAITLSTLSGGAWVTTVNADKGIGLTASSSPPAPPGQAVLIENDQHEAEGSNATSGLPASCASSTVYWKPRPLPPDARPVVLFVSVGLVGHVVPLTRLAQEMLRRGYDVSMATHESAKHLVEAVPGLQFVSLGPLPMRPEELRRSLEAASKESMSLRAILTLVHDVYVPLTLPLHESLERLLAASVPRADSIEVGRVEEGTAGGGEAEGRPAVMAPDLVVLDVAAATTKSLVEAPVVINSPTQLATLLDTSLSAYIPAWGTGYSMTMNLLERSLNFLFPRLLSLALSGAFVRLSRVRKEHGLSSLQASDDVLQGSPVLINSAFGLDYRYPKAVSPLVTMTGPLMPPVTPALPSVILHWLETGGLTNSSLTALRGKKPASASSSSSSSSSPASALPATSPNSSRPPSSPAGPVLYINLGNMPQLTPSLVHTLLDGLSPSAGPPFRVLWLVAKEQLRHMPASLPPHIRVKALGRGIPHIAILSHPAVRAVASHCGMAAAQEALYYDKPLLCIPHFADQLDVAQRVVDSGAGLLLHKSSFTADDVREAVASLLNDTAAFPQAAHRVSRHLQAAGGVGAAADVLESTLRLGWSHLRPADTSLPWYKAHNLDVYVLLSGVLALCAVIVVVLWTVTVIALDSLVTCLRTQLDEVSGGAISSSTSAFASGSGFSRRLAELAKSRGGGGSSREEGGDGTSEAAAAEAPSSSSRGAPGGSRANSEGMLDESLLDGGEARGGVMGEAEVVLGHTRPADEEEDSDLLFEGSDDVGLIRSGAARG